MLAVFFSKRGQKRKKMLGVRWEILTFLQNVRISRLTWGETNQRIQRNIRSNFSPQSWYHPLQAASPFYEHTYGDAIGFHIPGRCPEEIGTKFGWKILF